MESQPSQTDPYKYDLAFRANPYPAYAQLRATDPVHRVTLPGGRGAWLVTRYEDAMAVLRDERFTSDWRNALTPGQMAQLPPPVLEVAKLFKSNIFYRDPPDHARLRALVSKAFTPRLIGQMRGGIQVLADALLDVVQDKGEMDLLDDYAFPLSANVIAELLGVSVEDRDKFRKWTDAAASGNGTLEYTEKILPDMRAFADYLCTAFEGKRKNPKDDLISALVHAEEVGYLPEDELLSMVVLLLIAGHETTANLIGTGMLALLQHPDQYEQLKNDPSLIKPAVEELLRYSSPTEKATERFAREDVAIGETVIPKGEMVLVVIAAANRDPERFQDPDTLNIAITHNKHLAFGAGIHHCLGAALARMEGQIAFSTLLHRMPNLRLKDPPESLDWRPGLIFHGLKRLPVAF
jgi:cytochrome P450